MSPPTRPTRWPATPARWSPRTWAGLTGQMFTRTTEVFAGNLRGWADGDPPRWAVNAPAFCRGR